MSLKIKGWRKILEFSAAVVAIVLALVFFIRVAVWENAYYREKEGSERVPSISSEQKKTTLIETAPSEEDINSHTAVADAPRYLTIDKLGIHNARVVAVGIVPSGELGTPNNIFDVGWFKESGKPGEGGTLLIDGHSGGPSEYGVFRDLNKLEEGDLIKIERGDGQIFEYAVFSNEEKPLEQSDKYMGVAMRSPEPGKEALSLVTCTGEWSDLQKTYLSRQFVRAVLKNVMAPASADV